MPKRLEDFWGNLNSDNLQRRLFAMYKWNVGPREASYDYFSVWLNNLADWFEQAAIDEKSAKTTKVTQSSGAGVAKKETAVAPVETK